MTEKWVCSNCFDEEGIKAFIALNGEIDTCFFCSGQSTCIPIECIADHIMECLRPYYTDEPKGVYDIEEGIFWDQLDPLDILHDTVFKGSDIIPNYDNPICLELRKAFGDGIWTLKDPYGEMYWWERFSEVVKYKRRFFFLGQDLKEEEPSIRGNPQKLLSDTLKDCMNLLNKKENLTLFRCRYQKSHEQLENLDDFLSPPPDKATMSNRMSPPGIPHLYGATDVNTAFEEIKREKGNIQNCSAYCETAINVD